MGWGRPDEQGVQGENGIVCGILIYSSSGTVLSSLRVCLGLRKCGIFGTRGKERTLGATRRGSLRYVVLSVVVPSLSKLGTALGLQRDGGVPVVLLSTGDRSASGVANLSFKTSSCIAGPFGPLRLVTQMGSRVEHCISLNDVRGGSDLVIAKKLTLSLSSGRVALSNRGIGLATARCNVLRCLVGGVNEILSAGRVCRTI